MRRLLYYLFVSIACGLCLAASEDIKLTDTKAIETVVANYLKENPKAVFDALVSYRNQEMAKVEQEAKAEVVKNHDGLFNAKTTPMIGKSSAKIAIVEFMDYQCGHCKVMGPRLEALVNQGDVKVLVKLLPIRGDVSLYASKMALAAALQSKFEKVHEALLAEKGPLSNKRVDEILKNAGVDLSKAKQDQSVVQKEIDENYKLASALKLQGTPVLIFSNGKPQESVYFPGAVDEKQLNAIVKEISK